MTQLTIRRLESRVIEALRRRAAEAGRSMEEEARKILSEAVGNEQIARQREWVEMMRAKKKEIFGDRVLPDSSDEFRRMREERTRYIAEWALGKDSSTKNGVSKKASPKRRKSGK
jgi:plasmid stability protein